MRPHRWQPTRLPWSLGFSRQEYWSGLPFPSPMHESEKWKWSRSVVSDTQRPHGLQPTGLLHPWDFPVKSTGVGCHCLLWLYFLEFYNCMKIFFPVHFNFLYQRVKFPGQNLTIYNHWIEWFALQMNWEILLFLRLHPSTAFRTLLLTMRATPFFSKGFLPTAIDILVIWIKFAHSGPF